ncbi:hypothetical protein Hypma_008535 [Hypsizygus marmoreus]|uniref:Uncharacterized protein n=1 Tax=Hypsizygus marmoreus TaxID=39966 RepID=A0A369JQE1_HYPMA|nr:hypothetical protein Hypma_008535 [Hypsizygus marmoreus]
MAADRWKGSFEGFDDLDGDRGKERVLVSMFPVKVGSEDERVLCCAFSCFRGLASLNCDSKHGGKGFGVMAPRQKRSEKVGTARGDFKFRSNVFQFCDEGAFVGEASGSVAMWLTMEC